MADGKAELPPSDLSALELSEGSGGTRVRLRVKPGARADEILGVHGGALKLAVAAPPDRGKANRAVLRLLAEKLALPPGAIELLSGHGSRHKTVLVRAPAGRILSRLRSER